MSKKLMLSLSLAMTFTIGTFATATPTMNTNADDTTICEDITSTYTALMTDTQRTE